MKRILCTLTVLMALVLCNSAYADIFPPIGAPVKEKAVQLQAIPGVDPSTILGEGAQIAAALGTREGYFYDINRHEFTNYAAATVISYIPYGLSLDFGALNADGLAASIDFNVGAVVPSQNVPLLALFNYFYVGFGLGERYTDLNDGNGSRWRFAFGPTGEFKLTF